VNTQDQVPLEQYWDVVRRWWWLIVASVLVSSVSSYYTVSRAPRIYQASSTVMVGQGIRQADPDYSDFYVSERLAQTYIDLVQRRPILQGAAVALDLPYTPSPGNVSAQLVPGTQLVEISVRDTSPERARELADEVARQLILQTPTDSEEDRERRAFVQKQLAELERNIEETQAEIEKERARLDAANSARAIQQFQGNIAALQNKLSSYQSSYASLLQTVQGGTNYISVFEQATTPSRPISPRVRETVLLAAAIGLVLALGGAFLTEYLDDTVKTVDAVTRACNLPSLGAIPRIPNTEDADLVVALQQPRSGVTEAFRSLRTNIRFSSVDRPLRTLMITSADPVEGKSLVLANLAVVMAQEGRSVTIIDADLRRPTQHKLFDVDNHHGLSDAVLEEHPDLDAYSTQLATERLVEPFAGENGDGAQHAVAAGMGHLRILTSGPIPPNPADLLGSERMAALIERLTQETDIVLLDCPPVLAVTDAVVLAKRVDGVLLLANAGSSRRARLQRSAEHLRQIDAPLLGVVINRVTSHHGGYYYYDYYYCEDENGETRERRHRRRRRRRFWLGLPAFGSRQKPSERHNGKRPSPEPLPAGWRASDRGLPADGASSQVTPTQRSSVPEDATLADALEAKTTQPIPLAANVNERDTSTGSERTKRTRPLRLPGTARPKSAHGRSEGSPGADS
jgi:non-specific protein-tyrosine kinase